MLISILDILSYLIAFGPASLSIIVNIFLQKKLKRDGYKFINKKNLNFATISSFIPIIGWFPFIYIFAPLFSDSDYKEFLNISLKEKEIVRINPSEIEIKKRNKKKIKKVTLEFETKSPSKTNLSKEQINLTKELVNSDAALVLKIQTLLVKLKKINPESYKTLNMEYEQLAKAGKLDNFMLKDFLARLLLSLECDVRDASQLIKYLDFLILSYENKTPISNQISELSFKTLENIAREIITDINKYKDQDKIVIYKKIALLYLYLIYENKYINIDAIRNSCFNTDALLYGAIFNIYELIEKGIIENNLLFDLNEKYDLESVIKLIGEMRFTGNKRMIKSTFGEG